MGQSVIIDYTNYRGERAERRIIPIELKEYPEGTQHHHPEPGWYLNALDEEKAAFRLFAMKDIHSWKPAT